MKSVRLASVALLCAGILQLASSANGSTPTHQSSDRAQLTSVTGIQGSLISDTNNVASWITSYYSATDRQYEAYIYPGATLQMTWHVTNSSGAPLANTPVTLTDNLAWGGGLGTSWNIAGLNRNPNTSGNTYEGGTETGASTNSSGDVTFTITNTNSLTGATPTNLTSALAAESNENSFPWTRFVLQVGSDTFTANPNPTVNEATDLLDILVIPHNQLAVSHITAPLSQSFTYAATAATLQATVSSPATGTVTFTAGGQTLCTATVVATLASCTAASTLLTPATYTLQAQYNGSSTYASSATTSTLTINKSPVVIQFTAIPPSPVYQLDLPSDGVTVSLQTPSGLAISAPIVLHYDTSLIAGNGPSYSLSSLSTSNLQVGAHTLYASFAGNADYLTASLSKGFVIIAGSSLNISTTANYDQSPAGTLIWQESFTGASGNSAPPTLFTPVTGSDSYGTGEIENNTSSPTNISEDGSGDLVITAKCIATANPGCESTSQPMGQTWTSARIWTKGKATYQYGQLEARIWMPAGSYNWPAFWMLGASYGAPTNSVNWPMCGEIDIAEGLQSNSQDQATLHDNTPGTTTDWYGGGGLTQVAPLTGSAMTSGWHTYGILWQPNSIAFTLDGKVFAEDLYNPSTTDITQIQFASNGTSHSTSFGPGTSNPQAGGDWAFNAPFFIIFDDAIGGGSAAVAPNGSTATMKINWIKYYKYNGYGTFSGPSS